MLCALAMTCRAISRVRCSSMRMVGAETLIAATAWPCRLTIAAATQQTPGSFSSLSVAYPWLRTRAFFLELFQIVYLAVGSRTHIPRFPEMCDLFFVHGRENALADRRALHGSRTPS